LVNITAVILLGTSFNTGIPSAWHSYIKTLLEEQYSCFSIIYCLWDYSFTILSPLLVKSLPMISYPNSRSTFFLILSVLSVLQFSHFCHSVLSSNWLCWCLLDLHFIWSDGVVIQLLPLYWEWQMFHMG
jgi:hypothetical protein